MDDKGLVFTTDVLLAIIIVTISLGMMTNQLDIMNYQIQDFTLRGGLEQQVNDAADYLIKSPGSPSNWENQSSSSTLPGLAVMDRGYPVANFLHHKKISKLEKYPNLLYNLVKTNNYQLRITSIENGSDIVPPMGSTPPAVAKEIAVANRTVMLMPGETLFRMFDLTHINPGHPSNDTGYLWYSKAGNPPIYVGPGNVTTALDENSSVYITQTDLDTYDFYILVESNSGVTSVNYGFTDGDAVVNLSWAGVPFDDKSRQDAIDAELKDIYGGKGWQKLSPLSTGTLLYMNPAIQEVLDHGGGPDLKLWVQVQSDPKDTFDLAFVKTYKGNQLQKIPAKLTLTIWE